MLSGWRVLVYRSILRICSICLVDQQSQVTGLLLCVHLGCHFGNTFLHSPFLVLHSVIFSFAFACGWFWGISPLTSLLTLKALFPYRGSWDPLLMGIASFLLCLFNSGSSKGNYAMLQIFLMGKRKLHCSGEILNNTWNLNTFLWSSVSHCFWVPVLFHFLTLSLHRQPRHPHVSILYQQRFLSPTTTERRDVHTAQKELVNYICILCWAAEKEMENIPIMRTTKAYGNF